MNSHNTRGNNNNLMIPQMNFITVNPYYKCHQQMPEELSSKENNFSILKWNSFVSKSSVMKSSNNK